MRILGETDIPRIFGGGGGPSGGRVAAYGAARSSAPAGTRRNRVETGSSEVQYIDTPTQEDALKLIARVMEKDAMAPEIQGLARFLTRNVPPRNDWAELKAIYDGVKNGRADLKPYGLDKGVRYLADARTDGDGEPTDVFFAPTRVLAMLKRGENGFDCDDSTMLVGALVKACGFRAGARAYGQGPVHGYEHVFPLAVISKRGPWNFDGHGRIDESHIVGLDVTVPYARVGWQPPRADVFTALLD